MPSIPYVVTADHPALREYPAKLLLFLHGVDVDASAYRYLERVVGEGVEPHCYFLHPTIPPDITNVSQVMI